MNRTAKSIVELSKSQIVIIGGIEPSGDYASFFLHVWVKTSNRGSGLGIIAYDQPSSQDEGIGDGEEYLSPHYQCYFWPEDDLDRLEYKILEGFDWLTGGWVSGGPKAKPTMVARKNAKDGIQRWLVDDHEVLLQWLARIEEGLRIGRFGKSKSETFCDMYFDLEVANVAIARLSAYRGARNRARTARSS